MWLQAPSNLLVALKGGATLTGGADSSNALRTRSGLATTGDPNHKVDSPGDYDSDNDGYIDVSNASQLNAMRWDLDGDGTPATANESGYTAAFPNAEAGMGCGDTDTDGSPGPCTGYELADDIDLDAAPYNASPWWTPIGNIASRFNTTFQGNGHTIENLIVDLADDYAGLFGALGASSEVRSLALTGASVTVKPPSAVSSGDNAGVLAGMTLGLVVDVHAAGAVQAAPNLGSNDAARIGGLVGEVGPGGEVRASHADVKVSGGDQGASVGGLVGLNAGAVEASYASGNVTGRADVGGLVGAFHGSSGSISGSYAIGRVDGDDAQREGGLLGTKGQGTVTASYYNSDTAEQSDTGKGEGKTTAALTAPTGYAGIYAGWNLDLDGDGTNDEPWRFGTASQYPGLVDAMGNVHRPVTPSVVQAFGDPAPEVDSDLDGNADAYVKDDEFSVWLKFDAAVTVANPGTGGANAQVVVTVGSTDYTLNYLESDDTDTRLKFGTHTVVAADGDSDGIAVKRDSSDKLVRLSGTATMTSSTGSDANLKADADLKVRAAVDSAVTTVKVRGANSAPRSKNFTVSTGRNRDLTLARTDFAITDS